MKEEKWQVGLPVHIDIALKYSYFKNTKKGKMQSIQIFGSNFEERINRAIDDLNSGKGILLVDDENRENEGDLFLPSISDFTF